MPPTDHRSLALGEAVRIGDELLGRVARRDGFSVWPTAEVTGDGSRDWEWQVKSGLYDGVAGVVLFLAELLQVTELVRFRQPLLDGARWLASDAVWRATRRDSGFHAGAAGELYALERVAQVLGDESLDHLVSLRLSDLIHVLSAADRPHELMHGQAGTALGLALLAAGRPARLERVRPELARFVERLAGDAWVAPVGLCWNPSHNWCRGLTGLAHGTSGIALALLEISRVVEPEAPRWLCRQALAYEDTHYSPADRNWMDFRKDELFMHQDESLAKLESGEMRIFHPNAAIDAWCNGATGIGLVRARARELRLQGEYLGAERCAERALATVRQQDRVPDATLCHGLGGQLELLVSCTEAGIVGDWRAAAEETVDRILAGRTTTGRYRGGLPQDPEGEPSLFLGTSGIGLALLRFAAPGAVPPLLAPALRNETPRRHGEGPAMSVCLERLVDSACSRSRRCLLRSGGSITVGAEGSDPRTFLGRVRAAAKILDPEPRACVEAAVALDLCRLDAEWELANRSLWALGNLLAERRRARLAVLGESELRAARLALVPGSRMLLESRHVGPEGSVQTRSSALLLVPQVQGALEIPLTPLELLVSSEFLRPAVVEAALRSVRDQIDAEADEKGRVDGVFESVLRRMLGLGLLVDDLSASRLSAARDTTEDVEPLRVPELLDRSLPFEGSV